MQAKMKIPWVDLKMSPLEDASEAVTHRAARESRRGPRSLHTDGRQSAQEETTFEKQPQV